MRVFVYFNLHKKCFSVKALDGVSKGKVVFHADKVMLRNVEFRVSEAGRKRVLETGRKQVHAGVVGDLEGIMGEATRVWGDQHIWLGWLWSENWDASDRRYQRFAKARGTAVTYNPYMYSTFVDRYSLQAIRNAPMAYLNKAGRECIAFDPCAMPEGF